MLYQFSPVNSTEREMCKSNFLKSREISYKHYPTIEDLDKGDRDLVKTAFQYAQSAYAPYSSFHVGAVLRLGNGQLIKGVNQENASYPAGLCAERVALFSAGAQHPDNPIEVLAVCADNPNKKLTQPVFPCGFCIQVMLEFEYRQKSPIRILIGNPDTAIVEFESASLLMPFSFDPEQL